MISRSISIPALAKINWSLQVLGKRADGYHEIDTVLQTISLHDNLTFEVTEDPSIKFWCDDRLLPADESNLVWRAAAALRERYSIKSGVKIRLEKRIPTEAGLGGGSSDAAITLIALAHLCRIELSKNDLVELAKTLGSDVPFFLFGGTARGTSRGNVIKALADATEAHLLIIKPNASVATAQAYELLSARTLTSPDAKTILSSSQASDFSDLKSLGALQNDFESLVFQLEPEIKRAKVALMKSGALTAKLSGSGSAVFGIFENQDAQERAIRTVELEAGWRAFPCKTVGREQYRNGMVAAREFLACFSD
jgi:4-diphosphocytidyl-2-C-methyl-D-erythritol kinase